VEVTWNHVQLLRWSEIICMWTWTRHCKIQVALSWVLLESHGCRYGRSHDSHMDVGRADPMDVGVANHMAGCVQHLKCTTWSLVMALQLLCRSHFDTIPSNNGPFDPWIFLTFTSIYNKIISSYPKKVRTVTRTSDCVNSNNSMVGNTITPYHKLSTSHTMLRLPYTETSRAQLHTFLSPSVGQYVLYKNLTQTCMY